MQNKLKSVIYAIGLYFLMLFTITGLPVQAQGYETEAYPYEQTPAPEIETEIPLNAPVIDAAAGQEIALDATQVVYEPLYKETSHAMTELAEDSTVSFENKNRTEVMQGISETGKLAGLSRVKVYIQKDEQATEIEVIPEDYKKITEGMEKFRNQEWPEYQRDVYNACMQIEYSTDGFKLAANINDYICDRFSFEVTGSWNMNDFAKQNKGQCWHYSTYMKDMLKTFGYKAWTETGNNHQWVWVEIGGRKYKCDPTYNDTNPDRRKYLLTAG